MTASNSTAAGGGRRQPSSWQRRGYAFVVTAISAFIVALAVLRSSSAEYAATATLVPLSRPTMEAAESPAALKQALTSPEAVRDAAAEAGFASAAGLSPADVRRLLKVRREHPVSGSDVVSLSMTGADGQRTMALLNALAQRANRLPSDKPAPQDYRIDSVERALKAASAGQNEVRAARRQLNSFLAAHGRQPQATQADPAATDLPPTPPSDAEVAARGRVEQIRREFDELDQTRQALLDRLTPDHPRYQVMLDRIDRMKAQLSEARESVATFKSHEPEAASHEATWLAAQAERRQLVEMQTRLRQSVADAEQHYEQLAQAADEAHRLADQQEHAPQWRIEPAVAAQRLPHSTAAPAVLFATALAVVAGSGTMLAGATAGTIDHPADATAVLHLSVLGSLPDCGVPTGKRVRRVGRGLRTVILCSEIILAAFIVAAIVAAVLDSQFATQLTTDPLSVLADGMRRFLTTWHRA